MEKFQVKLGSLTNENVLRIAVNLLESLQVSLFGIVNFSAETAPFLYLSSSIFLTEGEKLDLGANRIHGVLGNPMYEIAMAHNLIDIVQTPKPHKVVAALEDGKQVPFSILQVCNSIDLIDFILGTEPKT